MSDLAISDLDGSPAVVTLAVADLTVGSSFREEGLCPDHIERLVAASGQWPPILVNRTDGVVIDGAHRLAAAQRLGLRRIEATLFDGGPEAAFLEFVRRNVAHGLLLTLAERKRAATRVLGEHADWSDRRIAEVCGLSPKTVGRLRLKVGSGEESPHLDTRSRVGRDNRVRPVDRALVRARVVEAVRAQPEASLRTIAAETGVSPETVRSVRKSLEAETGDDDSSSLPASVVPLHATPSPAECWWRDDAALESCNHGEDFLEWFERTSVDEPDLSRADVVPIGRIYQVADEARRRAEAWMRFARAVEVRSARSKG